MQWHEARNAILLRSYNMAPWKNSTLLGAVVDKGRRLFGNRSTQSLPGDLHSATNSLSSPSTSSQKKFKKSNDAQRDMSILAMTYILQDNSTIRELIRLIIGLNDRDDSGKVCTTCSPCNLPKLSMVFLVLWGPCSFCHIHSRTRILPWRRFI